MAQRRYQKPRTEQTGKKPQTVRPKRPRPEKKPPRPAGQEGREPAIESPGPPGCTEDAPQGPQTQPVSDEPGSPRVQRNTGRGSGHDAFRPMPGWDRCFYCFSPAVTENVCGRWVCERHKSLYLHPSGKVSVGRKGRRFASLHDLECATEGWVKR